MGNFTKDIKKKKVNIRIKNDASDSLPWRDDEDNAQGFAPDPPLEPRLVGVRETDVGKACRSDVEHVRCALERAFDLARRLRDWSSKDHSLNEVNSSWLTTHRPICMVNSVGISSSIFLNSS